MRYGDVCTGVGAASLAWQPLGWKAAWFSEIEAFPNAVLRHHWPDVHNLGDMTGIEDLIRMRLAEAPDVLVGGTPCQAFSFGGKGESLEDDRGALTLAFVELANAIDDVREVDGDEPTIVTWENVPGVLSTRDNAFGCFLAGLAGECEPLQPAGKKWSNAGLVSGPRRTVAWRILNAQHFGLAQRRERVFVVASARQDFDVGSVLFEPESPRRDYPPARPETGFQAEAGVCPNACWWDGSDLSQTLDAVLYKKQAMPEKTRFPAVIDGGRLRFITPIEGERLMGMPDNHTFVPFNGKQAPDTPRYMSIGNSMPVPCIHFIGERIQKQLESLS